MTIEESKEQSTKVKVKKGGEKAAPKKREIKEARKQSNVCRKDTASDEGVDVYD